MFQDHGAGAALPKELDFAAAILYKLIIEWMEY